MSSPHGAADAFACRYIPAIRGVCIVWTRACISAFFTLPLTIAVALSADVWHACRAARKRRSTSIADCGLLRTVWCKTKRSHPAERGVRGELAECEAQWRNVNSLVIRMRVARGTCLRIWLGRQHLHEPESVKTADGRSVGRQRQLNC